jgi:hypothetical protein
MSSNGFPVGQLSTAVALASGMISVQANCRVEEALVLLNQRALDECQTPEAIAKAVIAGALRFD